MLMQPYLFGSTVNWCANWYRSIGWSNRQNVKRRPDIGRAKRRGHAFQLNTIFLSGWWSPLNGIEDTIIGLDAIATQMERPIHGKENVVINNVGLVVFSGFFGVQCNDVYDFGDSESSSSVGPCKQNSETSYRAARHSLDARSKIYRAHSRICRILARSFLNN